MLYCSLLLLFCYFLWLFLGWSLFAVFVCLSTVLWSLNFIIFVMVPLHHIIVYYITKLHYSRLFSYYVVIIYLVLFLLFSFCFHFILLLVLLSPFKFYLIMCCICCFISYLCYCIYYHFISLFIPRNLLGQKCGEKKPTVSFFFSVRHIWKHDLIFLFLLDYKFFLRRHVLDFTK